MLSIVESEVKMPCLLDALCAVVHVIGHVEGQTEFELTRSTLQLLLDALQTALAGEDYLGRP